MSEIHVEVRPRPAGWADLPALDAAQSAVVERSASESLVVRGAPGSGRTTCALAVLAGAAARGEEGLLLVPDRVRADLLAPRVQALLPTAVRPVRTPASYAHRVVTTWRVSRPDPLGPVELVTGALQDEILAGLLARVEAPWPDSTPPEMRAMPAFRSELRDLFARAGEAGLDGAALEAAGVEFSMPQWIAAGRLLAAYLEGPEFSVEHREVLRVDLSRAQDLAASLIAEWDDRGASVGIEVGAPVPGLVVVDDLQDCTPSTIRLLLALRDAGSRVVAFADPDVAIATYRGGEPHLDLRLSNALGAPVLELGAVKGEPAVLRALVSSVVSGIGQTGPAGRRCVGVDEGECPGTGRIIAHLGGSNAQLGAHIAHALRRHRLHEGIPWEDQAVIVRSAAHADEFARHLRRGGVPVAGGARAFDFASQPTTRTLLDLIAAPDELLDRERARALVASPLASCDPLEVHRLLQGLSVVDPGAEDGDAESSAPMPSADVVDLLEREELRAERPGVPPLEGLEAAARIWSARTGLWREGPREALWAAWDAAGVADAWRELALAGDEDSAWYDDQLDAVVALMRVADVWEQRNPGRPAVDFAKELLDKAVPIDTIARVGARPGGVSVLTPAQAMGRRFGVVALVGLQDGAWPNTRLRTRSLRADLLADVGAGRFRTDESGARRLLDDPRVARRAVLDDERRLLTAAVSRCSGTLRIGAVSAEDDAPSAFFHLLAERSEAAAVGGPVLEPAPAPLNLAGQIADLRRAAASPEETAERDTAVALLALLAREGIRSADPDTWTGGGPVSSKGPIASGEVRLSPSRIEAALACPLKWFFGSIGADAPAGAAQTLGTLVHAVAQEAPDGDEALLLAALESKLEESGLDRSVWQGIDFAQRARRKVLAFAQYASERVGRVDVEAPVSARIGDVVVSGRLDRIEYGEDGSSSIVDLKTGTPVRYDEARNHAQLAVYQLALEALGHSVADARLVFLGDAKTTIRAQGPLDEESRAEWLERLAGVAAIARGASLMAIPKAKTCDTCAFRRACPAQDTGRRTVD